MPCMANSESRCADTPPKASRTTVTASGVHPLGGAAVPGRDGEPGQAAGPQRLHASPGRSRWRRRPRPPASAPSPPPRWRAAGAPRWWSGSSNVIRVLLVAARPPCPGAAGVRRHRGPIHVIGVHGYGVNGEHPTREAVSGNVPAARPMMSAAVIVDAVRSPMGRGKLGGALSGVHPVDLLAQVLPALVARTGLDPGTVDDVLVGCVGRHGEQSATPAGRPCSPPAGPSTCPPMTIERKCGSGQQAARLRRPGRSSAGAYDIVVAGGRRVDEPGADGLRPGARPTRTGPRREPATPEAWSPRASRPSWSPTSGGSPGRGSTSTPPASHQRAAEAAAGRGFDREIVADRRTPDGARVTRRRDDPRPAHRGEAGGLKPAFAHRAARRPLPASSTGRSPRATPRQLTDGAAALLVMSGERAAAAGARARGPASSPSAVAGDDPMLMLTGPIPATQKMLARSGLDASTRSTPSR